MSRGFSHIQDVNAEHPETVLKTHSPRPRLILRAPPEEVPAPEEGSHPRLHPEEMILTVDVLYEAGGAGHIVHFELR